MKKTNAMRFLEQHKVAYHVLTYDIKDGFIDGVSVAKKIDKPVEHVFKTLVTRGHSGECYVFVIPVHATLHLKKAAKACGEKSVVMLAVKDITKVTGYVKGGCSPLAMKRQYKTYIEESAKALDTFIFSAGSIGLQIETSPLALSSLIPVVFTTLI